MTAASTSILALYTLIMVGIGIVGGPRSGLASWGGMHLGIENEGGYALAFVRWPDGEEMILHVDPGRRLTHFRQQGSAEVDVRISHPSFHVPGVRAGQFEFVPEGGGTTVLAIDAEGRIQLLRGEQAEARVSRRVGREVPSDGHDLRLRSHRAFVVRAVWRQGGQRGSLGSTAGTITVHTKPSLTIGEPVVLDWEIATPHPDDDQRVETVRWEDAGAARLVVRGPGDWEWQEPSWWIRWWMRN